MPQLALDRILEQGNRAEEHLRRYFKEDDHGMPAYTGSRFESFGTLEQDPNVIAPEDLLAVSMLSVNVPSKAVLAITGSLASEISSLLERIPADRKFEDLSGIEFEEFLGPASPAQKLWDLLRQKGQKRWGVGPTTASKIMARKRPHLIPIYDSKVASITGMQSSRHQWTRWRTAFAPTDLGKSLLVLNLAELREKTNLPELSLLRVLDIVLWMEAR